MKQPDRYSSIVWISLSILIAFHSYRLNIGKLSDPGPGFIFFYSGILIGLLSLIIFFFSFSKKQESPDKKFENINWLKTILVLVYILLYALFLEKLGFLISVFLLIALLLGTIEAKKIYIVILVALAASLMTYGIFELWLHTRVPKGIFGI